MKLSIIIPAFNVATCIGRCLESVFRNLQPGMELVVVDDGSVDSTMDVLAGWRSSHEELLVLSQRNAGVSSARNAGLDACRGEYVMFVDADDMLADGCLDSLSTFIGGADLAVLRSLDFHDGRDKYPFPASVRPADSYSAEELFRRSYSRGSVCGVVFSRSFLVSNGIRFIEGLSNGEDTIFMTECLMWAGSVRFLDIPAYLVVGRDMSASRTFSEKRLVSERAGLEHIKSMLGDERYGAGFRRDLLQRLLYVSLINAVRTASSIPGFGYRALCRVVEPDRFLPLRISSQPGLKKKLVALWLNVSLRSYFSRVTTFSACVLLLLAGGTESFAFDRALVPEPVFEGNRDYVSLYYTAWQQAYDHIRVQEGIPNPRYIDEACWGDTIWIWDTEFMALFCKYAPKVFPGKESLDNFYALMLDNAASALRIQHPDNPPFFPWIEYEYYRFTGDKAHIRTLVNEKRYPQRYFRMFEQLDSTRQFNFEHYKVELQNMGKGYRWGNIQSGMDNTPRTRAGEDMLWVDAISQQALSALYTMRLAELSGDRRTVREFRREYRRLKKIVNKYYWDSRDQCYYDIGSDGSLSRILTPASFWPVLAELPTGRQARRMAEFALADGKLGGTRPWKTVSADDPGYVEEFGEYWKGAVWLPTAYMGIKALEKYKLYDLADSTAERVLSQMSRTYNDFEPHTIWECYNPGGDTPAKNKSHRFVRPDFCGWSALGPISLFIENVIGIREVDAGRALVRWDIHHDFEHGLKDLRFGDIATSLVFRDGVVTVDSNSGYKLVVNGKRYRIKPGRNTLNVCCK